MRVTQYLMALALIVGAGTGAMIAQDKGKGGRGGGKGKGGRNIAAPMVKMTSRGLRRRLRDARANTCACQATWQFLPSHRLDARSPPEP